MNPRVLRVSEYLALVNETFSEAIPSNELLIEGEVSDFRIAQQKWVSFDLKDEEAQAVLKCFMTTWQLTTPLEDGMRVRVMGYPKIYERFGTFKMNVQNVVPVGEGALRRAYELLKKKLEGEGLFDGSRKRPLPRFPERIGLITSRDAAAYGDFLRILNNRWSGVEIDFAHVHVQGREAVPEILGAFAYFNCLSEEEQPEVLVLTRGGGGLEDLHAFNDERVAHAVFQSKIPVVCAVGHERDESLCDYVADVRASTPSNAAERIVPSRSEVSYELETMARHIDERFQEIILRRGQTIERVMRSVSFVLERQRERCVALARRLHDGAGRWLPSVRDTLEAHVRVLAQLDPKRVLSRGYSLVTVNGAVLKNAGALDIGSEVTVQLAHGSFDAEVLRVNGKGKQKLV